MGTFGVSCGHTQGDEGPPSKVDRNEHPACHGRCSRWYSCWQSFGDRSALFEIFGWQRNFCCWLENLCGQGHEHCYNHIYTWRPFLSQIYAAMKPDPSSQAPPNCIWTKQVQTPIKWLLAFVHSMKTHLTRTWQIEHFKGQTSDVTICWDASPFGFGAVLIVDGSIVQYLADTPQPFEMELLESLAGLVALREWSTFWMNARAKLALRSDNVGALVLLSKLKTSSVRNAIVAREFALDLGNACFAPSLAEHIPGFSN